MKARVPSASLPPAPAGPPQASRSGHAWCSGQARRVLSHAPALALGLAVFLGLFLNLGTLPLFDVDEGAFGEATREMLARGDYVSTWLNGMPRFDKPILAYWLQAASVSLLGLDEFALRLPSALAACAWIAALFAFVRGDAGRAGGEVADDAADDVADDVADDAANEASSDAADVVVVDRARRPLAHRRDAWAAAFIAATSLGVVLIGRAAVADALLNLFLALAMFDIVRYQAAPRAGLRRRAFLWIGLGVLAKGPVALLIPGAASALAFGLHGRLGAWWRAVRDPAGWLVLLAVAAPWYVLEAVRSDGAFLSGFFMRHNVERFMAPLQGHGGGPLYYVPALLLLLSPYGGLLIATLAGARRTWRDPVDTALWCWFGVVFAFFSLAGTKLPHYVLYGATPLFVLMARRRAACPAWLALLPPLLFMAALSALPAALAHAAPGIRNPYLRDALSQADAFGARWQAGAGLLALGVLGAAAARRLPVWPRLAGAALACTCASVTLLLPAVAELQQAPVKAAALAARRHGWPVAAWRIDAPSFSVYRAAVTPVLPSGRPPPAGAVVLTRSDALADLDVARVLFRQGGVLLVRVGPRGGHG